MEQTKLPTAFQRCILSSTASEENFFPPELQIIFVDMERKGTSMY